MMRRDKLYVVMLEQIINYEILDDFDGIDKFKGVFSTLDTAISNARKYIELIKRDCISIPEFESSKDPCKDFGDEYVVFENLLEDIRDDSAFFNWETRYDYSHELTEYQISITPITINEWIDD